MYQGSYGRLNVKKEDLTLVTGDGVSPSNNSTYKYLDYFIKFNTDDTPDVTGYEVVSYNIARSLGIEVPDYSLVWIEDEKAFLTKSLSGQPVHAFHHFNCSIAYDLQTLAAATPNRQHFIDMCLFDGLILNTDRHAFNYLYKDDYLAPLIDNHSSFAVKDFKDTSLHIPVDGVQAPQLPDYIKAFIDMGCESEVSSFVSRMDDNTILWLADSYPLEYNKKEFIGYLNYAIGELYASRI